MSFKLLLIPLTLFTLAFLQCTETPVGGGGASETIAIVTPREEGISVTLKSTTAFKASVHLFDESYSLLNSEKYHDSTVLINNTTTWLFAVTERSNFNLFITDSITNTGTFIPVNTIDTATVTKKLTSPGLLSGTVTVQPNSGPLTVASNYYVFIIGSSFVTRTNSEGKYLFSAIPEGSFIINATSTSNGSKGPTYSRHSIAITGDSLSIHNFTISSSN